MNTKPDVRNLGSGFHSQLSMSTHISKLCSSAFFHLRNISRIRKFLSPEETKTLVHTFVTSRVDFCNSLLYGLPASQFTKVQRYLKGPCHGSPVHFAKFCQLLTLNRYGT